MDIEKKVKKIGKKGLKSQIKNLKDNGSKPKSNLITLQN